MKKIFRILFLFAFIAGFCSCDVDNERTSVLKIDGSEVPFLEGEEAVSAALGDNYSTYIDFEFPEGADSSRPVLLLRFLDEYDDYAIYSYMLNTAECDLENHTIEFLGYKGIDYPVDKLKTDFEGYLVDDVFSSWNGDSDACELYYVNGDFVGYPDGKLYSDAGMAVTDELVKGFNNGEISSYMTICFFESKDNCTEDIVFTICERREE